jgi:hypothetical protein
MSSSVATGEMPSVTIQDYSDVSDFTPLLLRIHLLLLLEAMRQKHQTPRAFSCHSKS